MRALQALDADLAGAPHRSIAAALFGEDTVERDWNTVGYSMITRAADHALPLNQCNALEEMPLMILESLSIAKNQSYEGNPEGYRGHLRFRNAVGAVELNLNEDVSAKILTIVGASAVDAAKDIARNLSANVFTTTALPKRSGSL